MKIKDSHFLLMFMLLVPGVGLCQGSGFVWQNYPFPEVHFSLQSPVPLKRVDMKNSRSLILRSTRGKLEKPRFLMSVFACPITDAPFGYDAKIPTGSKEIPDKMMKTLSGMKSMSGFDVTSNYENLAGGLVSKTNGTCLDSNGVKRNFKMLNFRRENYFWSVIIECENNDPGIEKIADFVINSFKVVDQ